VGTAKNTKVKSYNLKIFFPMHNLKVSNVHEEIIRLEEERVSKTSVKWSKYNFPKYNFPKKLK